MPTLPIIRLGHPALRKVSKPVTLRELKAKKFQNFLNSLVQTCIKHNGAGIAAPQVAVNKKVIAVNVNPKNPRYPKKGSFPLTILINPKIIKRSKKFTEDWEGDLSSNIRAIVPRSQSCVVVGIDRHGSQVKLNLSGFPARVFQHEVDHLNGIFFTRSSQKKRNDYRNQ